jgi:hypothetical protein
VGLDVVFVFPSSGCSQILDARRNSLGKEEARIAVVFVFPSSSRHRILQARHNDLGEEKAGREVKSP